MIPTRKELKLQEFAEYVLSRLEMDEEWGADTIDDIGCEAINMGLAQTNIDGAFETKRDFEG